MLLPVQKTMMVPSSALAIAADGECLMCCGFSLRKTVCLGNFEFIVDYFSSLSISPRWGDEGAAFMGLTRSGASTPWWVIYPTVGHD
jgi:hypothetical protein